MRYPILEPGARASVTVIAAHGEQPTAGGFHDSLDVCAVDAEHFDACWHSTTNEQVFGAPPRTHNPTWQPALPDGPHNGRKLRQLEHEDTAGRENANQLGNVAARERRSDVLEDKPRIHDIEAGGLEPTQVRRAVQNERATRALRIQCVCSPNHRRCNVNADNRFEVRCKRARNATDPAAEVKCSRPTDAGCDALEVGHESDGVGLARREKTIKTPNWLPRAASQDGVKRVALAKGVPGPASPTPDHDNNDSAKRRTRSTSSR
jgi:hypothetical protein